MDSSYDFDTNPDNTPGSKPRLLPRGMVAVLVASLLCCCLAGGAAGAVAYIPAVREVVAPELADDSHSLVSREGDQYYADGDYGSAFRAYDNVIKAGLGDARTYLGRGKVYILWGQYELARQDFEQAIALNDKLVDGHYWLGIANYYLYDMGAARSSLNLALIKDSTYAPARISRAFIKAMFEDYEGAEEDFRLAAQADECPVGDMPMLMPFEAHSIYQQRLAEFADGLALDTDAGCQYLLRGYMRIMAFEGSAALEDIEFATNLDLSDDERLYAADLLHEADALAAVELSRWQPAIADRFVNNRNNWPTGGTETDLSNQSRAISHEQFHWEVRAHNSSIIAYSSPDFDRTEDVYVSVDVVSLENISKYGSVGILARWNSAGDYYVFDINPYQVFSFDLRKDDEWTRVVSSTWTPFIRPDGGNSIAISFSGTEYVLLVNDRVVWHGRDTAHTVGGWVGLIMRLDGNETSSVAVDNFYVYIQE